jgi:hypothetical protein
MKLNKELYIYNKYDIIIINKLLVINILNGCFTRIGLI